VLDLVGCYECHGSIKAPIVKIPGEVDEARQVVEHDRHCPHCREVIPLRTVTCPHCMESLGQPVVTVDQPQAMVSIEDEATLLLECDGCQTQYRYDELQLEFLSDDLEGSPLGIWYCPHEHPIKVMEPTRPVDRSGEAQLLGVQTHFEAERLHIKAYLLDVHRDPYLVNLSYGHEQLSEAKSWVKATGGKVRKNDTLQDCSKKFIEGPLKTWPALTLTLAQDGCLVEFCS
jgi:hypothetical protein